MRLFWFVCILHYCIPPPNLYYTRSPNAVTREINHCYQSEISHSFKTPVASNKYALFREISTLKIVRQERRFNFFFFGGGKLINFLNPPSTLPNFFITFLVHFILEIQVFWKYFLLGTYYISTEI